VSAPLHKLPDGTWIDPATITALIPRNRAARHDSGPNRQPTMIVACGPEQGIKLWFESIDDATKCEDELAVIVNAARGHGHLEQHS
jgi:hypothetical protein